jgi:hypothetical protein
LGPTSPQFLPHRLCSHPSFRVPAPSQEVRSGSTTDRHRAILSPNAPAGGTPAHKAPSLAVSIH